ncbi:MAG: hypothetical protein R3A45_04570 [Bdellovibrionota bacterium]
MVQKWSYLLAFGPSSDIIYTNTPSPVIKKYEVSDNSKLYKISVPGLIVFAMAITFAAFDWIMTLDHHWYSNHFWCVLLCWVCDEFLCIYDFGVSVIAK